MSTFEVTRMRPSERSATVGAVARAFYNDPLITFFQPDLVKQQHFLTAFMRPTVVDAERFGEVWVARSGDDIAASAVWLPPGAYPRNWQRDLALNLRAVPAFTSTWRRLRDAIKLLNVVEHAHYKGEHWYLAILGCDPAYQRAGAGRALLASVLERADEQHVPVYLETQKEENLAYYARFGCEVVEKLEVDPVPPIWTLLRDAR